MYLVSAKFPQTDWRPTSPALFVTSSSGTTYIVVRHESDGRVVRRWIPPGSLMVESIHWESVINQFTVPASVIAAIPLDNRFPEPNQLVRYFAKEDDPIFAYDADVTAVAPRAGRGDVPGTWASTSAI